MAQPPVRDARVAGDLAAPRIPGGLLVLAALLIGMGCRMPWLTAVGIIGLTPPMQEIWPITMGAGFIGILGLAALAQSGGVSRWTWLLSLLLAAGTAVLAYPHYQAVTEEVAASGGDFGVSQGVGLWLIGFGIVTALVASAAGWGAGAKSGSR